MYLTVNNKYAFINPLTNEPFPFHPSATVADKVDREKPHNSLYMSVVQLDRFYQFAEKQLNLAVRTIGKKITKIRVEHKATPPSELSKLILEALTDKVSPKILNLDDLLYIQEIHGVWDFECGSGCRPSFFEVMIGSRASDKTSVFTFR